MSGGMRFGIVEDNREDFAALCRVLGPEHDVVRWQSSEQALAAFGSGGLDEFDMLFVDCNLPGADGVELVGQLRTFPGGDTAKIVMFSGTTDPATAERAREAGADAFEHKGHTLTEFKAAIARCFELLDHPPVSAAA